MIDMAEQWAPVEGWEGCYEVSSLGNVRSLPREFRSKDGKLRKIKGGVLKPRPSKSGHLYVSLKRPGSYRESLIHRLVAQAFLYNPDEHPHVLHWDDNPANNSVSNLRWGSDWDNRKDALRNGSLSGGILTDSQVREIKSLCVEGVSQRKIASMYGVSQSMVSAINTGRSRNDV